MGKTVKKKKMGNYKSDIYRESKVEVVFTIKYSETHVHC